MIGGSVRHAAWIGLPLLALAAGSPAAGSTAVAWKTSAKAGRTACIAAANLRRTTVSAPLTFSDAIGKDALLVRGTYRQAFMKGARGTFLCLYDRRTGQAEVSEAKGWSVAPSARLDK